MLTWRRTVTGSIGIAAILGTLTSAVAASAMPSARLVYLRGKGTDSCPSEVDVREAVQTRLGYDPFSTYAPSTMFAEVSATSGGFTANLKLVDGDNVVRGDRVLSVAGRCTELMDAMALTISIAIDPMSVTRSGPPPDAPPTEKPVEPRAIEPIPEEPLSADRPTAPPARKRDLVLSASLGPLASLGSAPAFSVGAALSVDARLGRLLGGIEGRADLPSSARAGALGRVETSLVTGSLVGGVREGPFFACAVGSLGRLAATSSDVAVSRDEAAVFLAAGFRVGVAVALTDRIEARGRAEVLANLMRHTLQISERDAYQFPVASANVSAAIAVRFW